MNEFLGRLTDVAYEFVGVIVPGVIATMLLLAWWAAMGDNAPFFTGGTVPVLSQDLLLKQIQYLKLDLATVLILPASLLVYLLGHMLLWGSRGGEGRGGKGVGKADGKESGLRRTWHCLCLRIPKPDGHYEGRLEPLLGAAMSRFSAPGVTIEWRQFYPVAKSYLARTTSRSLVATYQNKYTLHRSITFCCFGVVLAQRCEYRCWRVGVLVVWQLLSLGRSRGFRCARGHSGLWVLQ